jgi:molybdopterin/thiamine biosynthesis adenylyltransferase
VADLEEHQGEPVTNYFPYLANSIMLYDSDWMTDVPITKGHLTIGIEGGAGATIRGAIVAVQDTNRNTLHQIQNEISERYKRSIPGRWVRLTEPILESDPDKFIAELVRINENLGQRIWQKVDGLGFDIIGVLFPEEVSWRETKESWMFVARVEVNKSKGQKSVSSHFIRPARAGKSDLAARTGIFTELSKKRIAVIGLGSLGAPSAIEFARNGVSELHILDHDVVEAGTTVRWPLGLSAAGLPKVLAVEKFVTQNYPFTKIVSYPYRIGEVNIQDPEKLDTKYLGNIMSNVDLVFDASAELGLNHLLSDLAAEYNIPYICISTTPGTWGGAIVRVRPEETSGCWMCYRHWLTAGDIPPARKDPFGEVQPVGCASPTFTGTGFDAGEISLGGVRLAISTLTAGAPQGYPKIDWDVAIVNLRDENGEHIPPDWKVYPIQKHPSCSCPVKP